MESDSRRQAPTGVRWVMVGSLLCFQISAYRMSPDCSPPGSISQENGQDYFLLPGHKWQFFFGLESSFSGLVNIGDFPEYLNVSVEKIIMAMSPYEEVFDELCAVSEFAKPRIEMCHQKNENCGILWNLQEQGDYF